MRGSSERLTLALVNRSAMFCTLSLLLLVLRPGGRAIVAGRSQYPVDDALVSGATAEVAGQCFADLRLARVRVLGQQGGDLHEESGRAKAALKSVGLPHRLLQGVHHAVGRKPPEVEVVGSSSLDCEHETGPGRFAVDQDGTGVADAVLAAQM